MVPRRTARMGSSWVISRPSVSRVPATGASDALHTGVLRLANRRERRKHLWDEIGVVG